MKIGVTLSVYKRKAILTLAKYKEGDRVTGEMSYSIITFIARLFPIYFHIFFQNYKLVSPFKKPRSNNNIFQKKHNF